MEESRRRKLWQYGLAAVLSATAVFGIFRLLTVKLLKALNPIAAQFTDNETILRMLESLQKVTVRSPLWWAVLTGMFLIYGGRRFYRAWRHTPRLYGQAVLWGIVCLIFIPLAFVFSLWITRINGIPVRTMIPILWRCISTGAL